MNKQVSQSDWQLIIASRKDLNMYKMRHWPLTIHLNLEMRVWPTALLTYILCRRLSIFNYYMILIRQLRKTYGMVFFTSFHYMVYLNIFYQILKISKNLFVISLTIIICQVHLFGKYISMVILPYQCLIYKPTFLATCSHSCDATI